MSDTATAWRLLHKCKEYVSQLRAIQVKTDVAFLANVGLQWQVERGLQLATQSCIDLADEMLYRMGMDEPDTAAGSFSALEGAGILDGRLSRALADCVRFRNILVHDYADLDPREVLRHWRNDLAYYEEFCGVVRAWITAVETPAP